MDILLTKEIIEDIPVLIVDVEQQYLEDEEVYGLISEEYHNEAKAEVKNKMDTLYDNLKTLKQGTTIFATHDLPLYKKLENLPIQKIGYWLNLDNYKLNNSIYHALKHIDKILICGLWKERCVLHVTKFLREKGINAILLDNDKFTISAEVIGDQSPIDQMIKYYDCNMRYIN
jgi:hypothetical protein